MVAKFVVVYLVISYQYNSSRSTAKCCHCDVSLCTIICTGTNLVLKNTAKQTIGFKTPQISSSAVGSKFLTEKKTPQKVEIGNRVVSITPLPLSHSDVSYNNTCLFSLFICIVIGVGDYNKIILYYMTFDLMYYLGTVVAAGPVVRRLPFLRVVATTPLPVSGEHHRDFGVLYSHSATTDGAPALISCEPMSRPPGVSILYFSARGQPPAPRTDIGA